MENCDPAYDKIRTSRKDNEKAKGVLRGAGYARGGGVGSKSKHPLEEHSDEKQDKKMFKKEISKVRLKYADGGKVDGGKAKSNAGKMARGGSKPHGHTKININVGAGQAEKEQAMHTGVQLGARLAAAKMAGGPRPGAGAPMQARPMVPPPGAGPAMPPPGPGGPPMAARGGRMHKSGGRVGPKKVAGVPHLTGGSGGALGRLEKMKDYGTKPKKK